MSSPRGIDPSARRPEPPGIDEMLARLEDDLRRLKIEYDVYLNGGSPRPPDMLKSRVESRIAQLFDVRGMTFAQRFRYNGLVARHTSLSELWRRIGREREATRSGSAGASSTSAAPVALRCTDPEHEPEVVRALYDAFIRARRAAGEPVAGLTYETFERRLAGAVQRIRSETGCGAVELAVGGGAHATFTARALGERGRELVES